MTRADFATVSFQEHLGDHKDDMTYRGTAFAGDRSSEREFHVEGVPVGAAYLVLQLVPATHAQHEVLINGERVDGERKAPGMIFFAPDRLKRGRNTMQVRREDGGDAFAIYGAAIHWREREPLRDAFRAILDSVAEPTEPEPDAT